MYIIQLLYVLQKEVFRNFPLFKHINSLVARFPVLVEHFCCTSVKSNMYHSLHDKSMFPAHILRFHTVICTVNVFSYSQCLDPPPPTPPPPAPPLDEVESERVSIFHNNSNMCFMYTFPMDLEYSICYLTPDAFSSQGFPNSGKVWRDQKLEGTLLLGQGNLRRSDFDDSNLFQR